jgi:uncharacterized protein
MRLGVLSDTHNQLVRTRLAIALLQEQGAEALIHCGDVTGPEVVAVCAALPSHFVFGNNDADNIPALRRAIDKAGAVCLGWGGEVTLAGQRIAVAHGHLGTDVRRLLADRPDYLLSGHSHIAGDHWAGQTRRINPGALHRARVFTVALIDLDTTEVRFLPVPRLPSEASPAMPSAEARKKPPAGKKPPPRKPAAKPAKSSSAKQPPGKKPPAPPGGSGDDSDEKHQRRLWEIHSRIDQGLGEARLTPAQRREFGQTAKAVLGRMTKEGLRLIHENVKGFKLYPTFAALTAAYKVKYPVARITNLKGAFDPAGTVHLDGGGVLFGRLAALGEFYAHELTHALDAPNYRISGTKEWRKAWAKEIRDSNLLGDNAATDEHEGFAEFGQFLLGHPQANRANTRAEMKNCLEVWERHGL